MYLLNFLKLSRVKALSQWRAIILAGLFLSFNSCNVLGPERPADHLLRQPALLSPTVKRVIMGKASYYGPGFHGNLTANGETYWQYAFTAAHKTLPFGTIVTVTNLTNNRSCRVRINDRGPFIPGREIDLSLGVAQYLDFEEQGVVPVKLEVHHDTFWEKA